MRGLLERYGAQRIAGDAVLRDRLAYELDVITKMGFSSYFLIVWDFVKYARDRGIPVGPGRGSAVGSLVSYCLKITDLDPLRFDLLFERFLNPDRISMPDIDTDFCVERRDEVIRYVTQKYGEDRVAQIVTFGTMAARAAIRDAGRALGVPLPDVDRIAKLVPSGPGGFSIKEAVDKIPELKTIYATQPEIRKLLDTAKEIEGLARNAGTHAAGVVISAGPLMDYTPLVRFGDGGVNTQYDMDWIERIGLLKMDFLGLRNLTVMENAVREIRRTVDSEFDLSLIPYDDAKTYEMLARGETMGIFQLESEGMKRVCAELKPSRFEDVVALVALFRPGPMELIPQYVANKHGRAKPQYLHPKLETILSESYGIPIYQEQVMQMARDIAGFTMGEADELRKVMGKKQKEKIPIYQEKFVNGAIATCNMDRALAERLFHFIEPFAGYGFNKSHAVAYAWIAYQTAYLKAKHPLQYLAALMTSVKDKTDKLVEYIEEAKKLGIEVLPPDVNESLTDFAVVGEAIRFGLAAIKGVGEGAVRGIIATRLADGRFADLFDFAQRVDSKLVNRRVFEALIKCGALDSVGGNRAQKLAALDAALELAARSSRDAELGQVSLFGESDAHAPALAPRLPPLAAPTTRDMLAWERETLRHLRLGTSAGGDRAAAGARRCDAGQRFAKAARRGRGDDRRHGDGRAAHADQDEPANSHRPDRGHDRRLRRGRLLEDLSAVATSLRERRGLDRQGAAARARATGRRAWGRAQRGALDCGERGLGVRCSADARAGHRHQRLARRRDVARADRSSGPSHRRVAGRSAGRDARARTGATRFAQHRSGHPCPQRAGANLRAAGRAARLAGRIVGSSYVNVVSASDPTALSGFLDGVWSTPAEVVAEVAHILADVRARGDGAVIDYARRYDDPAFTGSKLRVAVPMLSAARASISGEIVAALELAKERIARFHQRQRRAEIAYADEDGSRYAIQWRPLSSVAVYAPRHAPSSILMGAVPAKIAGVARVIVLTPAGPEGVTPAVLFACALCGVDELYAAGGPHAIAAAAFGTGSIARVDKIVGHAGMRTTEAKRQVFGACGVDALSGGAEVLIVADDGANSEYVVGELLAQAERAEVRRLAVLSESRPLLDAVAQLLDTLDLATLERGELVNAAISERCRLIEARDRDELLSVANRFAPAILCLHVRDAAPYLERIDAAGAVFVGDLTPLVSGEYLAGTNHVVPTSGTARFSSALSLADFTRSFAVVENSEERAAADTAALAGLAELEGFPHHAASARMRFGS